MLGSKEARKHENELARLADDDSPERADGLDGTLEPILSWLHDGELCRLRKKRLGRHRAFFAGHHSQCRYQLFYLKMNKKAGVDREEDKAFQSKILKALSLPDTRVLPLPPEPDAENEQD